MPVKSNGTPDEFDSPFYLKNEQACLNFDAYIVSKKGETRGVYNSFSYLAIGKIPHPCEWEIKIKKSQPTSGNIWLSSNYQSLLECVVWKAKLYETSHSNFKIRRRKMRDIFLLWFHPNCKKLKINSGFIVFGKINNNQVFDQVTSLCADLIRKKLLFKMTYKSNQLEIDLRSSEMHYDIFEELIKLNLD